VKVSLKQSEKSPLTNKEEEKMDRETMKIGLACFVGGAVCTAVALLVLPALWWLGMLAGFAAGYLAYEFREVLQAVPKAARAARQGLFCGFSGFAEGLVFIKNWFAKSEHPFFFGAILCTLICSVIYMEFGPVLPINMGVNVLFFSVSIGAALAVFGFVMYLCLFYQPVWLGAYEVEKKFWSGSYLNNLSEYCYFYDNDGYACFKKDRTKREELLCFGRTEAPLTYPNVGRWFVKGVAFGLCFLFWRIPVRLASLFYDPFLVTLFQMLRIFVLELPKFVYRFVRFLVLYIHSSKRLLCGVDGALGGSLTALWALHQPELVASSLLLVVCCGGILGATLGVVNYRVVSPRLAKYEVRL